MLEDIAREIHNAAANRQKAVMVHFQVLKNADALRDMDPKEFCRIVGIEETWAIEFRKMISLSDMIRANGFVILPQ